MSLLGMTRAQLNRLVFYETTFISLLAIGTGIAAGLIATKLFFVSMASLLDLAEPIPYIIAPKALWLTGGGFIVLFEGLAVCSLFRVGRNQIVQLLKAAKQPRSFPVYSKWLVILAILCLTAGYGLAWMSGLMIIVTMFPILCFVVLGTYFLFTQGSVAILRRLRRKRRLFYRHTHLMTISQLVFKLKDNARVLFVVAILSAVVLTASGTFYTLYEGSLSFITKNTPHTFSFSEQGLDAHDVLTPETVHAILEKNGASIKHEMRITGLSAYVETERTDSVLNESTPMLMSNGSYNQLVDDVKGAKPLKVDKGHTVIVHTYLTQSGHESQMHDVLEVTVDGQSLKLQVDGVISQAVLNHDARIPYVLVMDDAQYDQLQDRISSEQKISYYGYELHDWKTTQAAIDAIESKITNGQQPYFVSRVGPYLEAKQMFSLTLFIGMFVSVLFFLASGSLLYFKLFTELQEDQAQFRALHRIGFTHQEMKKVVTTQIGLMFFLPFLVGVVHAAFALKILGDLFVGPVWLYGLIVVGVYFVLQGAYFLLSRKAYLHQMGKGIL